MQPRLRPFPLLLLVGLVWCGAASARQTLEAKQVAAPAADILAGISVLVEEPR